MFASARKGNFALGQTRRGTGTKIIAISSANGLSVAVTAESASLAECRLLEAVLAGCFLDEYPKKLIWDKACDSDALDQTLAEEYGIEMIAPNRGNRGKPQDGRQLRRYKRRWNVERLFAWMQNFRRLVTRSESPIENYFGFAQLACAPMLEASKLVLGTVKYPGRALCVFYEFPMSSLQ